jgi:hypothetical protein
MAFPTTTTSTDNVDSSTDDPSLARADLLSAVQHLNTIITEKNTADGVCVLDGSGLVPSTQLPATYSTSGTTVFSPGTGIVNIQDRLRLTPLNNAAIVALLDPQLGDIVIASNISANAGPGVVFYSGTDWRGIGFGNIALSGNVQFTTIT